MTTTTTSTLCGLALALLLAGSTFPAHAEDPGLRIGFRDLDLSVAEDVAELYRITSYNVCYTKLLRASVAKPSSYSSLRSTVRDCVKTVRD